DFRLGLALVGGTGTERQEVQSIAGDTLTGRRACRLAPDLFAVAIEIISGDGLRPDHEHLSAEDAGEVLTLLATCDFPKLAAVLEVEADQLFAVLGREDDLAVSHDRRRGLP